jgi:hypothetical protein
MSRQRKAGGSLFFSHRPDPELVYCRDFSPHLLKKDLNGHNTLFTFRSPKEESVRSR